jgi:hypothetical protein
VDEETIGLLESPEPIDPETSLDETDRTAPWPRLPVPVGTQRVLQIILGVFWIIDAALQYQPYMFGKQFVPTFIAGNAAGQPEPISWLITTAGHFISPDVGVWNFLFATVQVVIGFGLLFRRSVRPALVISFFWAFGVWFFGEGLGMVLTGSATALTGAPGSVLIYGLLGLMAWPRRSEEQCSTTTGIASSAAGQGIGGVLTPLSVWAGYWILAALLFLLPLNRTSGAISSNIAGMAPGTPEWYSHFLTSFGNAFASIGTQSSWVLTIGSLVIGLGPLLARRPQIFLLAGGVLSFVLWITGQGFLGGVFSGSGTDPNTGPLVIVLALAMVPIRTWPHGRRPSQHSCVVARMPPSEGALASCAPSYWRPRTPLRPSHRPITRCRECRACPWARCQGPGVKRPVRLPVRRATPAARGLAWTWRTLPTW